MCSDNYGRDKYDKYIWIIAYGMKNDLNHPIKIVKRR